ncbi:MAG: hypothetical protein LBC64_02955 [Fibromonadaceae bacterium]|jgi:hypothetical protein|nr:hypothetical protein [Fibromonadaceae bacterium]
MENTEENEKNHIREKRINSIVSAWKLLTEAGILTSDTMFLSQPLLEETVEYYLSDRDILKTRYKIEDKIQLYKVAGLIANAIVRVKPIIPKPELNSFTKDSEIYANEILAIYHALAVCSEYDTSYNITEEDWFPKWLDSIVFMLHQRRHTAEMLMSVFETISRILYKNGLKEPK